MKQVRPSDGFVAELKDLQSLKLGWETYHGKADAGTFDEEIANGTLAKQILKRAIYDIERLGFKIEPMTNDDCVPYAGYPLAIVPLKKD